MEYHTASKTQSAADLPFPHWPKYLYCEIPREYCVYDVALDELESCLDASLTVEQEISAKELSRQIDRFLATLDEENQMMFVRR